MDLQLLSGVRILLTDHTGFRGYWLNRILLRLGACVSGISLPPEEGSLFQRFGVVCQLADLACKAWGSGATWVHQESNAELSESKLLLFDSNRVLKELAWKVKIDTREAVNLTVQWEKEVLKNESISIMDKQIDETLELQT